jgi:hypothetical protein
MGACSGSGLRLGNVRAIPPSRGGEETASRRKKPTAVESSSIFFFPRSGLFLSSRGRRDRWKERCCRI